MKGNGMKKNREPIHRLEKELSLGYREREGPPFSPEFQRNVMRDVHRIHSETGAEDKRPGNGIVFRRMVLPFASVATLTAVVLLTYFYMSIPGMEQDLFALLTDDPSGLLSSQIF